MDLWIGSPADERERLETVRMTARAFRGNDAPETVAGFQGDHDRPGFALELQRVLKLNGRIVAGVLLVDKKLRLGKSILRCCGVGDVATEPEFRGRGLGRRLMEHCVEWMTERGYDMTLLFGIEDYYHKFGYRPAGCESIVTVAVAHACQAEPGELKVRKLRRPDLPAVARLHARLDSALPLTLVRSLAHWEHLWPQMRDPWVVTDDKDCPKAAMAGWRRDATEEAYLVRQVVALPTTPVMSALLAQAARLAGRAGASKVRFFLSHDHPFAHHCREYGADFAARYPKNDGCMLRILKLHSTLQKLLPELSARLALAGPGVAPSELTLSTDIGDATLVLCAGGVTLAASPQDRTPRVRMDQGRLTQLVCGFRGIDELARLPDVAVPKAALPPLRALFPAACPYIWQGDRF